MRDSKGRFIPQRQLPAVRECPYCGKQFANVKNHILLKHQAEAGPAGDLSAADLLGDKPDQAQDQAEYKCLGCGATVRKGETPCWKCGQRLVWDGIP